MFAPVLPVRVSLQVGAGQILEIGQGVGPGADRVLRGADGEADRHPGRGIGIAGRVAAGNPAIHGIVAGAADEGVVAGAAAQRVVAGAAAQRVVAIETAEDIGAGIACQ